MQGVTLFFRLSTELTIREVFPYPIDVTGVSGIIKTTKANNFRTLSCISNAPPASIYAVRRLVSSIRNDRGYVNIY